MPHADAKQTLRFGTLDSNLLLFELPTDVMDNIKLGQEWVKPFARPLLVWYIVVLKTSYKRQRRRQCSCLHKRQNILHSYCRNIKYITARKTLPEGRCLRHHWHCFFSIWGRQAFKWKFTLSRQAILTKLLVWWVKTLLFMFAAWRSSHLDHLCSVSWSQCFNRVPMLVHKKKKK